MVGQPIVDLHGERAVAETSVQIPARLTVSGVFVGNIAYARFIDRLVRQGGHSRIASRIIVLKRIASILLSRASQFNRLMSERPISGESGNPIGLSVIACSRWGENFRTLLGAPKRKRIGDPAKNGCSSGRKLTN